MKKIFNTTALTMLFFMGILTITFAQEEETSWTDNLTLSGSVDAYFRANFNAENDLSMGDQYTFSPATSFANKTGFALGMANIIAAYDMEKVGFVADLAFGPKGTDAVFLSNTASSSIVNQLYAYWNVTDKVTLTMGNFNTFLGYEVISPTANFNYSTSYMFSYGPFSHTGLKADFDLGSGWSLMAGVFNPTDATDWNPSFDFAGGAQLGYDFGAGSAYLNTLFAEDYFQVDLTAGVDVSEKMYVGLNTTVTDDLFYGVAGYLQFATSDVFSIGTRVEYFSDQGVEAFYSPELGTDSESVLDVTLTGNIKIQNLTLIPEVRFDAFSYDAVVTEEGAQSGLASFLLAAVYSF